MDDPRDPGPQGGHIDAAELQRRQRAARERIRETQRRAEQARTRLAEQRTTATSPDRAVTVTVDAAGTLVDLAFAASAGKVPLPALATTVLRTYRRATTESVGRTEALLSEVVGETSPVLGLIRATVTEAEQEDR